ncbi:metal-sensitive transcriptional regulator [Leucobacter luti]|uniref:metal-sensitive transcriptional regulator n=1 Tax=Leucobacter luti TaxID=340320 RepID=UPI003B21AE11
MPDAGPTAAAVLGATPAATPDSAETKRKIANRLRRAHGQLAAVIAAVEGEAHCRDVVQQLSAVTKALDRAGYLVISNAMQECLADPDAEGSAKPDELEKLFLSLA